MEELLRKAENTVVDLWRGHRGEGVLFHNLQHTQRMVKDAKELIEASDLSEDIALKLLLAAWFRNTGYMVGGKDPLKESCLRLEAFLLRENDDPDLIETVKELILSTTREHTPATEMERQFSDIYWSSLGRKGFTEMSELRRMEYNNSTGEALTISEWRDRDIEWVRKEHRFYTEYAREHWEPVKQKNIRKLIKNRKKENRLRKKEKLKAKFKGMNPDRGVQTLYRVTLRNHIKLSDIADTKANILLSVNAIIISLALSNLIPKLDNPSNTYLVYPTLIFIIFSIIAMALSIAATRPNVTKGEFDPQDVRDKKVNLLFFGNFHKMSLENYEWAITEMLKDQNYIYSNLTKDLYYLGVVLERKYRILRWTYTTFLMGIIVSVIAFAVAFKYFGPERMSL